MDSLLHIGLQKSEIESIISILHNQPQIKRAILFGSRAKGTFSNGSDVDIAIVGQALKLNDVVNLSIEIDELLLPYKFDIVIYNRITEPELIQHIDRVGIELTKKN